MKFPIPGLGLAGAILSFLINQKKTPPASGATASGSVIDLTAVTKFLEETKRQLGPVAGQDDEHFFWNWILNVVKDKEQFETLLLAMNDDSCMSAEEASNLITNLAFAARRQDDRDKTAETLISVLGFTAPDHAKFAETMRTMRMLEKVNNDSELTKLLKKLYETDVLKKLDSVTGDPANRGARMSGRQTRIDALRKKLGR